MTAREELLRSLDSIPFKYLAGLSAAEQAERAREILRRVNEGADFSELPSDSKVKTKPSVYSRSKIAEHIRDRMKTNTKESFIRAAAYVSGVPAAIIRDVHERGAAAWGVGHRPGASQVSWARARVYSFLSGGKTQKTADADLWRRYKETLK